MARARIRTIEASAPPLFQGLAAQASAIGSHHLYQRLPRSQRTSLGLVHVENVAQLCGPSPTPELLWQWAGGLLTWSYVANRLGLGVPELDLQLQLSTTLIRRFAATRVVQLRIEEKALAKRGAPICDALAAEVSVAVAVEAAQWSEAQMQLIMAAADVGREIALKPSPAQGAA